MKNWYSEYDKFTGNGFRNISSGSTNKDERYQIEVRSFDMGRTVGYKRVAVHFLVVPPGKRTSLPHAESSEEEFFYVVKGKPDLWLNGFIHSLQTGHAVGFPAGTGIAHCVINNTEEDVFLLVVGEQSKNDNLCAFPINDEYKVECPIWWSSYPIHELGPHSGKPGPVTEADRAKEESEFIVYCPNVEMGKSFHYPGDNENFDYGTRISTKLGLKALGIWFSRLPSGRRTAFPHAHSHEEECGFVVKGNPTLWMDGFTKTLQPDDYAAFPSNTGISHTLINDTDTDVYYFAIGEAIEFAGEKIIYPLNPLRQQECIRKEWYWLNAPNLPKGNHSGLPKDNYPNHIQFRIENDFNNLLIEKDGQVIGNFEIIFEKSEARACRIKLSLINHSKIAVETIQSICVLAEDYLKRAHNCEKIKLEIVT